MMKALSILALAGALAGCAEVQTDVGSAISFIDAPSTQQAIATLKAAGTNFVCVAADAQSFALAVEKGVKAGQSIQGTGGQVLFASNLACATLGGSVTTAAITSPSATTAQ